MAKTVTLLACCLVFGMAITSNNKNCNESGVCSGSGSGFALALSQAPGQVPIITLIATPSVPPVPASKVCTQGPTGLETIVDPVFEFPDEFPIGAGQSANRRVDRQLFSRLRDLGREFMRE